MLEEGILLPEHLGDYIVHVHVHVPWGDAVVLYVSCTHSSNAFVHMYMYVHVRSPYVIGNTVVVSDNGVGNSMATCTCTLSINFAQNGMKSVLSLNSNHVYIM